MNYRRLYDALILRGVSRQTPPDAIMETHHIVPRAHGGDNSPANLVRLTCREHYLAHWLLWRIHRDRSTARAFRLLNDASGRRRGRGYEAAKRLYAESMRGDSNVAKRSEVRQKISQALKISHPYKGKKRPEHSALIKSRGCWVGENNPWFGTGDRQRGALNHIAKQVAGSHPVLGSKVWDTYTDAAQTLGVTIQAVHQALKKGYKSKGWELRRV